jgi:ATP-binding protein involved in chromosome partitioning
MSIGFLIDPEQALIWRGPMVTGALMQLLKDVSWGELEYLVLDLPPGTGDIPLTLAQNVRAAGVVLVSTPQDVALADVIRAKLMFEKVSIPILGIVENMSTFICPHCRKETQVFAHGGARLAAEKMGIRFLGDVPLDLAVREGGDKGVPIVAGAPESPQAEAFQHIAREVATAVSVQVTKAPRLPVLGGQRAY